MRCPRFTETCKYSSLIFFVCLLFSSSRFRHCSSFIALFSQAYHVFLFRLLAEQPASVLRTQKFRHSKERSRAIFVIACLALICTEELTHCYSLVLFIFDGIETDSFSFSDAPSTHECRGGEIVLAAGVDLCRQCGKKSTFRFRHPCS